MHIAITGNIGVGKTTLAALLAAHYGWDVLFEDVDENPYLKDFYSDMPRWAFHLQIYFLTSRFRQVIQIGQSSRPIIQDRTIYEDAHIFATNLYQSGFMPTRDFENYLGLFSTMSSQIKPPRLLIYLRAGLPKLLSNIRKRDRDYERNLSVDYLSNLNERYEEWIKSYDLGKLLVIDANHLNYTESQSDFDLVTGLVEAALSENGLTLNESRR